MLALIVNSHITYLIWRNHYREDFYKWFEKKYLDEDKQTIKGICSNCKKPVIKRRERSRETFFWKSASKNEKYCSKKCYEQAVGM